MAAEPANGPEPEPVVSLVKKYKQEFQEKYNYVRNVLYDNSKEFKDCIAKSKQWLQEAENDPAERLKFGIVQPLKNLTNIGIAESQLLDTFAWTTVMMFSFWIGHNVCSAMLNPILSILLTNTQMAALALIIPIVAHRATNIGIDVKSRSNLQMFATLHGIVTGYTFKDYHLHLPLPFIVPLFIAASACFISRTTKTSRIQFLSISLLAGFLANCLLGWIIAGLTFSYLLAAIMQTLVALVTLQYYIDHWEQDYEKDPYFYMLGYQCAIVCTQLALLFIFGTRGG